MRLLLAALLIFAPLTNLRSQDFFATRVAQTAGTGNSVAGALTAAGLRAIPPGSVTGQMPRWNGTAWVPATPVGLPITIADVTALQAALDAKAASSHTHALADLLQSAATTGQVPTWNGSAWAPASPQAGITGISYAENLVPNTDVTAALQAMLNANASVSILRPGVYNLSIQGANPYASGKYCLNINGSGKRLHLGSGVTLRLLANQQVDADGYLFGIVFGDRSDIVIDGSGTIDMNSLNQSGWSLGYGQEFGAIIRGYASNGGPGCSRIRIEGINLVNTFGNPVNIGSIAACADVSINRVRMEVMGEGPQVINATNVNISACVMRDPAPGRINGDGIEVSGCRNVTIYGNQLLGSDNSIGSTACDAFSSQDVVLANNVICNWNGVIGIDHFPGASKCTRVSVIGNQIKNCVNGSSGGDGSVVSFSGNHWFDVDLPGYWLPLAGTTVTITRSGSTATVAHTAHGFAVGERVKLSGANQSEYNGIKTVASVATNTYTITVSGSPATPATGTIKDRRYDHLISYHGDTFEQCGPLYCGGVVQLEVRGCTFLNPQSSGGSGCVQVIEDIDSTTDVGELRMSDSRFINTSVGIYVVGNGSAFTPPIYLHGNDFAGAGTPVEELAGGSDDAVTGSENIGYYVRNSGKLSYLSGEGSPTISQIPDGAAVVWNNTAVSEIRVWVRSGSSLLRSPLLEVPVYGPLLDGQTNIKVAYGLRLLRTAYTGPLIRVRRSSDDTESDIDELDGELDTATLLTFAGAGNAFVKTIYDQSGNANNCTNATNSLQPKIVNSGALVTVTGGQPGMQFDGTDDYLLSASAVLSADGDYSVFGVADVTSTNGRVFAGYGENWLVGWHQGTTFTRLHDGTTLTGSIDNQGLTAVSVVDNGTAKLYNGTTLDGSQASGATFPDKVLMGAYWDGSSFAEFAACKICEYVIFDAAKTAQRTTLAENQMAFWGIQ